MKTTLPPSSAAIDSEEQDHACLSREFEEELLIERENRIRQIETDIADVNDIMKRLANLVVEQRAVVDSIERNIDSTYTQVNAGRAELQKTSYQTKFQNSLFVILLFTALIILITITNHDPSPTVPIIIACILCATVNCILFLF